MSNDIVVRQHVTAGLRRRISRHEQNEPPHDSSGGLHVHSGFGTDVRNNTEKTMTCQNSGNTNGDRVNYCEIREDSAGTGSLEIYR